MNSDELNKHLDHWYYTIGINPIPVVSRYRSGKEGFTWKEWQLRSLPEDLFVKWKNEGAYNDGVGITVGTVWRGEYAGKNLIFIDCDNSKAINELVSSFGRGGTLKDFAARFLVEQHLDNPNKAHVYFYSDIQFPKKSSDILEREMAKQKEDVGVPLYEIKGRGSHGIAFATPSVHKDGYRYEIIGTRVPILLDEHTALGMRDRIDEICKNHGLHYLDAGTGTEYDNKIPMESLFEEDFQVVKGNNRHEALMRIMESLILRNRRILKPEIIKDIAKRWNEKQCAPPLDNADFERQWKDANAYVQRLLRQQGKELSQEEIEQARRTQETTDRLQQIIIEQFRKPKHDIPTYSISQLGVNQLQEHVIVTGTVVGLSELVPSWKMVKWLCKICGNKNESDKYDMSKPPKTCTFCAQSEGFLPELDSDMKINRQTILLQDGAYSLSCVLEGQQEQMNTVKPGQKVQALGIQKFKTHFNKRLGENEWIKYFELLDIKPITGLDVTCTEQDIEYFKQLAASVPDFISDILLPSFAPHVRGNMNDCKLVCIYTLGSQSRERPFNAVLLGPPAKGKTQLTEYTSKISHYGNLTEFIHTSIAGLTSETVTDPITNTRIAKPGILATYSMACFTDMNAAVQHAEGKKLLLSMNHALENKVATSGKAGGAQSFPANCAVLIDSNNYAASWYYEEPIRHNLQFAPPSFLSRIDLGAIVPKEATTEDYEEIADANFESYAENENPIKLHEGDWTDPKTGAPRMGFETLRKFFYYISQSPLPPLPKEDQDLRQYFKRNYVSVMQRDYELLVDGRYLRTAMLLARVIARLLMKEKADKSDLEKAIEFVNKWKNIEVTNPKTGEKDGNYLVCSPSKQEIREQEEEELSKLKQWVEGCKKAKADTDDGYFTISELTEKLASLKDAKWTDEDKIKEAIQRAMKEGHMMEKYTSRGPKYTWRD